MTIQQRTYNSKNLEYASQDCGLARFGISIYREVNSGQLDESLQQIENNCPNYIITKRGEGWEIPSAINILETREARLILNLGNLAVQSVNDFLYHNVPSLHTTLKVETEGVELFGWENSSEKTIGVTIKDPALSELLQERSDIIDGLNGLVCGKTDEYCYIQPKTPHVSLARINPNTPEYVVEKTKDAVRCSLPTQLILKRAVIFYPGTGKR